MNRELGVRNQGLKEGAEIKKAVQNGNVGEPKSVSWQLMSSIFFFFPVSKLNQKRRKPLLVC